MDIVPRDVTRDQNDLMVIVDKLASFVVFDLKHGMTQQELAELTGIPESTIGEDVGRGVTRGWLAREMRPRGPPQGGWEYAIYLTPAGRAVAPAIQVARVIAADAVFVKSGV